MEPHGNSYTKTKKISFFIGLLIKTIKPRYFKSHIAASRRIVIKRMCLFYYLSYDTNYDYFLIILKIPIHIPINYALIVISVIRSQCIFYIIKMSKLVNYIN